MCRKMWENARVRSRSPRKRSAPTPADAAEEEEALGQFDSGYFGTDDPTGAMSAMIASLVPWSSRERNLGGGHGSGGAARETRSKTVRVLASLDRERYPRS